MILLGAISAWIGLYAAELLAPSESLSRWLHQGVHFAIAALPIAASSLVLRLVFGRLPVAWLAALSVVPAISATLNLIGSPIFWVSAGTTSVGLLTPVITVRGPWFWVHTTYAYAALATCLAILGVRLWRADDRSTRQGLALVLALVTPWSANAISLFTGLSPHLDPTPLGCAVSAACLVWISEQSPSLSPRPALRVLSPDSLAEGLLLVDLDARVLDANAAALEMLELPTSADLAKEPLSLDESWVPILKRLERGRPLQPLEMHLGSTGAILEVTGRHVSDALSQKGLRSLVLRDITKLRRAEVELQSLQGADAATGIPTRSAFLEELQGEVVRATQAGARLDLIVLGFDNLREVNETAGSSAGDAILRHVGGELQRLAQEFAGSGKPKPAGRLGSATFAIAAGPDASEDQVLDLSAELVEAVDRRISGAEGTIRVTARAGVARFPDDASDTASFIRAAEFALRTARHQKLLIAPYQRRLDVRAQRTSSLARDLRGASSRGELHLVYQPRLDLSTQQPTRAEALLRWRHPELGDVSPGEFIPIAEASGAITEVGAWALTQALQQFDTWRSTGVPLDGISINLAAAQLSDPDLFHLTTETLRTLSIDPSAVELEITETSLLHLGVDSATALRDLRAIGTQIFLDDFGTGYASMAYLNEIDPDGVKLDRSFVADVDRIANRERICAALLDLSREFGVRSVAEGVERPEELAVVRKLGCHEIQGYLFSRPLLPADVPRFLASCESGVGDKPWHGTVSEP